MENYFLILFLCYSVLLMFWRTFWCLDVFFLCFDILFDVLAYFLMLWRTFLCFGVLFMSWLLFDVMAYFFIFWRIFYVLVYLFMFLMLWRIFLMLWRTFLCLAYFLCFGVRLCFWCHGVLFYIMKNFLTSQRTSWRTFDTIIYFLMSWHTLMT